MSDWAFDDNLFEVSAARDVPLDAFHAAMARRTFACIRGVVGEAETRAALTRIEQGFDRSLDHPAAGQKADAVRSNFQKINLGGESRTASHDDARFFRAFYNPFWAEDIYEMHRNFRKVAQLRNFLSERPLDFAIDRDEGGMWTAARMHQFPRGGGFLVAHRDTVLPAANNAANLGEFYQPVMLMTQKGMHFEQGGGFSEVNGEQIIYEDYAQRGDVVIYDTTTVHGVEDIDPREKYVHETINGRISCLVTLYRSM